MLTTSNFAKHGRDPRTVSISRGVARFCPYVKRYIELAPPKWLLDAKDPKLYDIEYKKILAALDPKKVYDDIVALAGPDAILLCWESFNVKCHRRLVAEFFEQNLGIIVPEFGHERHESIAYDQQPSKWDVARPKAQFDLNF